MLVQIDEKRELLLPRKLVVQLAADRGNPAQVVFEFGAAADSRLWRLEREDLAQRTDGGAESVAVDGECGAGVAAVARYAGMTQHDLMGAVGIGIGQHADTRAFGDIAKSR